MAEAGRARGAVPSGTLPAGRWVVGYGAGEPSCNKDPRNSRLVALKLLGSQSVQSLALAVHPRARPYRHSDVSFLRFLPAARCPRAPVDHLLSKPRNSRAIASSYFDLEADRLMLHGGIDEESAFLDSIDFPRAASAVVQRGSAAARGGSSTMAGRLRRAAISRACPRATKSVVIARTHVTHGRIASSYLTLRSDRTLLHGDIAHAFCAAANTADRAMPWRRNAVQWARLKRVAA